MSPEAQTLVADAIDDGVINDSVSEAPQASGYEVTGIDQADVTLTTSDWENIDTMLEEAASRDESLDSFGVQGQAFLNE